MGLGLRVMVFNILALSCGQLYWWKKQEYPEKSTTYGVRVKGYGV
jgi:hypothetical protein